MSAIQQQSLQRIIEVVEKADCLCDAQAINAGLDQIAAAMNRTLCNLNPLFLSVMIGGIIPTGLLSPRLTFPLQLDYIHATRYQGATQGGEITWRATPSYSLKDRVVVIIDDILDGGLTLAAIKTYCEQQGASKIYTAVLIDKPEGRTPGGLSSADFVGLSIANRFVFGYGLDYDGYLRNSSGIYAVAPEHQ